VGKFKVLNTGQQVYAPCSTSPGLKWTHLYIQDCAFSPVSSA